MDKCSNLSPVNFQHLRRLEHFNGGLEQLREGLEHLSMNCENFQVLAT